jgi:Lrp/AsnC family leucine-responsive transcriptional regulator
MDAIDRKILSILGRDGRISATNLASEIALSTSATTDRLRRLAASPVVRRFTVDIDPAAIGRSLTVFIDMRLRREADKGAADAALLALDGIVDARHVTGRYDYQLHVVAIDVDDLDQLLEALRDRVGAEETVTRLALRTVAGFPRQPAIANGHVNS